MRLMLTLLIMGIALEGGLLAFVLYQERRQDNPLPSDTLIVLGARVLPSGVPSITLRSRLDRAAELYALGVAPYIIVCGARGEDEPDTEANVMADYLVRAGVPDDAIFREDQSRSTRENLARAKVIMQANGMDTAVVITSDYHLWRSLKLAGEEGINASGAAARVPAFWYVKAVSRVRETMSIVWYTLRLPRFFL